MHALFYEVNANQQFEFPHDDCDRKSTAELMAWWCRPDYFAAFIARKLGAPATAVEATAEVGAAWMRLKFAAEVCNPTLVLAKIRPTMKFPGAKDLCAAATERYAAIDVLANALLNHILNTMEGIVGSSEFPTISQINSVFPTIRSRPLGMYDWRPCAPSELSVYPYSVFLYAIYEAVLGKSFSRPH